MKKNTCTALICLMLCMLLAGCQNPGKAEKTAEQAQATEQTKNTDPAVSETLETEEGSEPEKEEEPIAETVEETDYEALYAPVFSEVIDTIKEGYDYEKEYSYMPEGLIEKIMYRADEDLLQVIGYVMKDVSGDGIPELLIGCDEDYGTGPQSYIFSVFTIAEGEPFSVFEGWSRSDYRWMGDDHFYYFGSGGVSISLFGENHLCKDGTEIVWDDFYFSDEDTDGEVGFYHNTTGVFDTGEAEKLDMSDSEFFGLMEEYEARCQMLPWTPIGDYQG